MRFGKIAFKAVELKGLYAPASRVFDPQKYPPHQPGFARVMCQPFYNKDSKILKANIP